MAASPTWSVHWAVHTVHCDQFGADELISKVAGQVDKVIQGGVLMSTSTADLQVCVHHRKAIGCLECAELKPSEPFCRWHVQKGSSGLNSAHSSEPCGNQLPLADSENQWRTMDQNQSGTIMHFINGCSARPADATG